MNITDRNDIAKAYAEALQQLNPKVHNGQPADFHFKFADAILTKDAYALKLLSNGLNDIGKATFTTVTGLSLPKTQGATWQALLTWAAVSKEADAVHQAERDVRIALKTLQGRVDNADEFTQWIQSQLNSGYDSLKHVGNKWLLVNAKGDGFDLSAKGTKLWQARPLIEAEIALRAARAALAVSLAGHNVCSPVAPNKAASPATTQPQLTESAS